MEYKRNEGKKIRNLQLLIQRKGTNSLLGSKWQGLYHFVCSEMIWKGEWTVMKLVEDTGLVDLL